MSLYYLIMQIRTVHFDREGIPSPDEVTYYGRRNKSDRRRPLPEKFGWKRTTSAFSALEERLKAERVDARFFYFVVEIQDFEAGGWNQRMIQMKGIIPCYVDELPPEIQRYFQTKRIKDLEAICREQESSIEDLQGELSYLERRLDRIEQEVRN